ncbi:serine hydrolase [Streptacidiphilus sp. P02-A3a]|uniref:serine hydrolase domain-containing protein n=1 Tax=Streptacidiphilus sp. P02-A3a TaxID=2704468 RepID=UPI0015F83E76|nr:serine hydrolase domain-containing protein [Streptacidiphilus sp. P02-A3a]QMU70692.1 beta-lactamase family protein [Streptacidiphilus sp. P02-A3a]
MPHTSLPPRRPVRLRTLVALTAGSLALTGVLPAVALAEGRARVTQSAADRLPPVDPTALRQAISGLPNQRVVSAVINITGSAGSWRGASGSADLATGQPASAEARFRIGSVTKVFTAAVVLQLVAEHRVTLDRTIQHYLPGVLPGGIPPITVAELLDHTSGLPGATAGDGEGDPALFVADRFEHPTPAQMVASIDGQPMSFAPGTEQQYNGVNYYLLGMLVEKVTGHSYADEVTERVLRPLRLRDTSVPAPTDYRIQGPHLDGYLSISQNSTAAPVDVTEQSPYPWAEGGMISSAGDLNTLMTALLDGRLLPAAERRDLMTVPDVPYLGTDQCQVNDPGQACFGMGLERATIDGVTLWGKTGSRPGYTDGTFATADLQRVLTYGFTPTDENATYNSLILAIADAALARP